MANNPCEALQDAGTAVWLDTMSREIVEGGQLDRYIDTVALSGVTSNPAIFHKAMTSGTSYDAQLMELSDSDLTTEQVYEALAIRDIQMACDVMHRVYERTGSGDGFVSLEVSPHLARDTEGTYAAAERLHAAVGRPNLMIKIPGTPEGIPAIEKCLINGIPINVTLLFSVDSYESVARAYVSALGVRAEKGLSLDVSSVASFFVSRIDSLVDGRIEALIKEASGDQKSRLRELPGKAAVHNARLAYASFKEIFGSDEFRRLAGQGARFQRPLWASTSTKNPEYRDVLYVETLVGEHTVNTMPVETLEATMDHAEIVPGTVEADLDGARLFFEKLEGAGISFEEATDQLLDEGIRKFVEPYEALLSSLEEKRGSLRA